MRRDLACLKSTTRDTRAMSVRSAVIVGATRNLGLHIALSLDAQGWSVVGVGRSAMDHNTDVGNVRFEQMDLSNPCSVDELGNLLQDVSPDLIVYNAVAYGPHDIGSQSLEELERMFRINTLMPYLCISAYFDNHPCASKTSCVMINSDSIFHANRQVGSYAASKAALKVMTFALADICRVRGGAAATLLLGPLADEKKLEDCARIAKKNGTTVEKVIKALLRRGHPFFLREEFFQFEECYRSIEYIYGLKRAANGMVCKLDGGSSGSLF